MTSQSHPDRSAKRSVILIGLVCLALIPVGTGLYGITAGLTFGPGSSSIRTDYFDSEYRFLNGVWVALGLALLWAVRHPQQRRQAALTVLVAILGGAAVRVIHALLLGWPPLPFNIALVIEIVCVPAVTAGFVRRYPTDETPPCPRKTPTELMDNA